MTMVLLVHAAFATRPWVQEHLPAVGAGAAGAHGRRRGHLLRALGVPAVPAVRRAATWAGRPQGKTGTFLRRRSLRVLPGYWFALTFCVVFLGQILGSAKNAFLYYSLLFPFASQNVALGGGPGQEGNYAIPQAWSLTAEYLFYFMLPVRRDPARPARARRRRRRCRCATRSLICGALYLFGQLFRLYFLVAEPSWARVAAIWAPNWVDFFAIGMATATWSAAHHAGHAPAVAPAVPRRSSRGVVVHRGARRPELRHVLAPRHSRRVRRRVLGALVPVRGVRVLPARAGDVR